MPHFTDLPEWMTGDVITAIALTLVTFVGILVYKSLKDIEIFQDQEDTAQTLIFPLFAGAIGYGLWHIPAIIEFFKS